MQGHEIPDDEVSLQDLWKILLRYKMWVIGFPLLVMIFAAATTPLIKPKWEAMALVRIGTVGQGVQTGQGVWTGQQTIEPAAQVVERTKLTAFRNAVLFNLGLPIDSENHDAKLYRDSLQVKALRSNEAIEVRVQGFSQANALRYLEATIDILHKSHNERAAPEINRMHRVLQSIDKKISQFTLLRDKFERLLGSQTAGFMENIVLTNNIVKLDEMLLNLKTTKDYYEFLLSPMQTFPTAIIDKVSLYLPSVAKKKIQIILMAGVFGLIVGVGGALLAHARAVKAGLIV